jgi:hypothetical protein
MTSPHRSLRTLAVMAIASLALALPLAAQATRSPDEAAVLATVNRLFETMRTKDTAGLRAVFEPGARLVGIRTRTADSASYVQSISVDQWVAYVNRDTRGPWIERAFNPVIHIDGTLATVWAEYDFHLDTRLANCGTDAVQLLKLNGAWKIVSIADTYRTTCPVHPFPP